MGDSSDDKRNPSSFGARLMSGLKDLIIEEDVPPRSSSAAAEKPSQTNVSSSSASPSPANAATAATPTPAQNSSMTNSLMEQVLNRATAYTALTEAMTPLEEIIPDEMTRYRAAFAVIKKSRTLDQVIQAIDLQHMQILETEMLRFATQAKEKEASDVEARITEARTLKGNIEAAELQVVKIRQEMDERIRKIEEGAQRDRRRVEELNHEVEEKRQAIASVQRQFDGAANAVKEALLQAKAKILKYLSA